MCEISFVCGHSVACKSISASPCYFPSHAVGADDPDHVVLRVCNIYGSGSCVVCRHSFWCIKSGIYCVVVSIVLSCSVASRQCHIAIHEPDAANPVVACVRNQEVIEVFIEEVDGNTPRSEQWDESGWTFHWICSLLPVSGKVLQDTAG